MLLFDTPNTDYAGCATNLALRNKELRERSGNVSYDDAIVSFLYELMRDYVPPGKIEAIMLNVKCQGKITYTNGYLAQYAADVATRLRS